MAYLGGDDWHYIFIDECLLLGVLIKLYIKIIKL